MEEEKNKGWRDPYLTDVFLETLRLNPECFLVPQDTELDLSEAIIEEFQQSGIVT